MTMLSKVTSGFPNPPHQELQMFPSTEDLVSPSSSLLFNLSILKDKFNQLQTLMGVLISPDHIQSLPESPNSMAVVTTINSIIQEIIVTASSMMVNCQQMRSLTSSQGTTTTYNNKLHHQPFDDIPQSNFTNNSTLLCHTNTKTLDCFGETYDNNGNLVDQSVGNYESNEGYEIIELDAADLLARYTHCCPVCGKGFKRDANLRMHMRAHGDEYKNSAALSNPTKNRDKECLMSTRPKKYSCPEKGCRWNKEHAKFQPLKSMICVRNHYKRSHCPKLYVCKKCNKKQFSVTSDLRSHEKHCGYLKWQCSCGTTFSRKDKLMGHVALFIGHAPAINNGMPGGRLFQEKESSNCR